MANARFIWDNAVAAANIAASAEASGYPASYLNNRARWKPWRSTATTGNQTVTATFTSRLVQAVAIVNYLAHTGGTIKAEYWTGAAFAAFDGGTGLFTLPASNRTRLAVLWFPAGRTTTQIRITFTNTGAVNMAVELGALVIGPYFEPTIGLTDDLGFDYQDPSNVIETPGGQELANERQKYLGLNTVFEYLTAADRNNFLTMFDTVGVTKPLIYAVDPTNVDQIVYGRFLQLPLRHQVIDQWTIQLPFKEVR
jgi:hypothetical protein